MARILHLITSVQLGGAEMIAFNLAEHCKGQVKNIDSVLAELHITKSVYAQEKKKELAQKNVKTISLTRFSKRLSLFFAPLTLVYYVLKLRPTIIHSHTDLPDFVAATSFRILNFLGIKTPEVVRTIQNSELWPVHDKIGRYTEKVFENDRIVGVSGVSLEAYKRLRVKNQLKPSQHQYIIHNSCAIPRNEQHPFKIDRQKINIAFCGRFELQKGIDILIDRITEINEKFGNAFLFHVVGSGTYCNEVKDLARKNTNVLVYDAVPNIANKFHSFDFLIMPSRFEGLALTSIEASLARVPVIAAVAPGLVETLPAEWPLVFNLDQSSALMHIFGNIMKGSYDLDRLKDQAYAFAAENFSHSNMIARYETIYSEIE